MNSTRNESKLFNIPNHHALIRRKFSSGPAPIHILPFVKIETKTRSNFWDVPKIDDFGSACNGGRQFACDLLQYLKDNPLCVGSNVIGLLVADMTTHAANPSTNGYAIGFWSTIEAILYRAAIREDHWDFVQTNLRHYARLDHAQTIDKKRL